MRRSRSAPAGRDLASLKISMSRSALAMVEPEKRVRFNYSCENQWWNPSKKCFDSASRISCFLHLAEQPSASEGPAAFRRCERYPQFLRRLFLREPDKETELDHFRSLRVHG